jgi:hypothetical protein
LPAASALAVIAMAAGCSSSTSPGTDVGLTSTTIRIASVDDINTPVQPGLFQRNATTNCVIKACQNDCAVIAQVRNGQWQRVYPSKPGTFDCSRANLATIKMNLTH